MLDFSADFVILDYTIIECKAAIMNEKLRFQFNTESFEGTGSQEVAQVQVLTPRFIRFASIMTCAFRFF